MSPAEMGEASRASATSEDERDASTANTRAAIGRTGERARTESMKRLSRRHLQLLREEYPPEVNAAHPRPATRGECEAQGLGTPGNPCPFVSCAWHLYLDVGEDTGSIKLNFPGMEVWELPETCALSVAARDDHGRRDHSTDGATLEQIGVIMNLSRERVRQLESRGLAKMRAANPGLYQALVER